MTRTLVIESAGELWGSERALLDLVGCMIGIEMAVCCPPDRPLNAKLAKQGTRIFPYYRAGLHRKTKWHRAWAALGVLRACLEFYPSTLYLNQAGAYKVVLPAAKILQIPVVAHTRIFEDVAYLAQQIPSSSVLRGIIAVSAAMRDEVRRFPQLNEIPVHLVYDGYSTTIGSVRQRKLKNCIACVGRVVPIKGQDVLVQAIGLLHQTTPSVRCSVAGEGDENFSRELKQLADGLGLSSIIEWLGFVEDVAPLIRESSVLVCPSHREPLGRVIFEAWDAHTIPVVYSKSGGAAEIVAAANGGILYHQQKPESLAAALQEALNLKPAYAAHLVENGRTWMRNHCDPRSFAETMMKILLGVSAQDAKSAASLTRKHSN